MTTSDLCRIWRDSLRVFFAPLVGAITGAFRQTKAVNKEVLEHRHQP
jgi:hypothetical protein